MDKTPLRALGSTPPFEPSTPYPKRDFGKDVKQDFLIAPEYRNMNHGSFGSIPKAIQEAQRYYQDQSEARPDIFIRYGWLDLLEDSREAVAPLLGVDKDTVVFVANATTGVNTVIRNLVWAEDGKDEILRFDTIYGACGKTVDYVVELSLGRAASRVVCHNLPSTDAEVVSAFRETIKQSRAAGKRPRVAIIDVVSSIPGVRVPFEQLVAVCHEEGILSLVDGAQGIGLVDLRHVGTEVKPDFFISNCHKWLFAPRGCAVLHVPKHNQPLIRSTLPTSWSFTPPGQEGDFAGSFAFCGTVDNSNYLCVRDATRWRREVLGGEEAILAYTTALNKKGGSRVAEMLGTEVLENSEGTLTNCAMCNVALSIAVEGSGRAAKFLIKPEDAPGLGDWMQRTLGSDYKTWVPVSLINGCWWVRLSAQVYLDEDDYEATGKALLDLCERVGKGDYKN